MKQSVESNSFGFEKLKAIAHSQYFNHISDFFLKKKNFSENPVKPGYGNLVLITATNCSS